MADLALESLLSPDMPMDVPPIDYQGLGISGGYDRKASVPSDVFPTIGTIQGVHRESGTTKVGTMTDDNRLRVDTGGGGGGAGAAIPATCFYSYITSAGGTEHMGTISAGIKTVVGFQASCVFGYGTSTSTYQKASAEFFLSGDGGTTLNIICGLSTSAAVVNSLTEFPPASSSLTFPAPLDLTAQIGTGSILVGVIIATPAIISNLDAQATFALFYT